MELNGSGPDVVSAVNSRRLLDFAVVKEMHSHGSMEEALK